MISKYFIPALEDIRVGYECEKMIQDYSKSTDIFLPESATQEDYRKAWDEYYCSDREQSEKYILTKDDAMSLLRFEGDYRTGHGGQNIAGFIRTPYLTKEQIEAEGWKIVDNKEQSKGVWYMMEKGNNHLRWWSNPDYIEFYKGLYKEIGKFDSGPSYSQVYQGECKDINTFRYICKLLGI